jgi:hypothetical protein
VRTDDGWSVEIIRIDGVTWYEVKRYGSLVPVGISARRRGLVRTAAEVEKLLGASFGRLK